MPGLTRRIAGLLIALCSCACAQSPPPISEPLAVHIPRVSRPPRLAEFLAGWPREAETRITEFRQYEPGDGVPASEETTAYLSYDQNNLYVVFVCREAAEKLRARLAKREDIGSDDKVIVNLDTFHDHQHAYSFFVNPLGVQLDGIWTEGQGRDDTWDTLWYSEGRLVEDGYIVWIAIPFKSLRFPRAPVQNWGIELGRAIQHNNEMSTWPYTTQRVESFTRQFATLNGLEQIAPGRNWQFIPYLVLSRSRSLDQVATGGSSFQTGTEVRAGLDAKMVLRNAFTLDMTVNPDFSQVESDEPQVTVNQRFEVFFPEKRPFFIENAGYFQTPVNLFFSRRIGDPQAGVRLTGKVGNWGIGAMAVDDRVPEELIPSSVAWRDVRAAIGVVRLQRDLSNQSTVGLLVTSRDFASTSNRVFALDARFQLNQNWVLAGQWMRSYTRVLDGTSLMGPAYWAELSHTGRHLVYASRYADFSPGFHTELGYVPRVDIRKLEQYVRYYWKPEHSRVVLFGPDVTTTFNWNRLGQLQDWIVDASFGANLRGQTGLGCRHVNAFELFQGRGLRHYQTDCGVNAGWLRSLEFTADYGHGSGVNYHPGPTLNPFVAGTNFGQLGFTWRPTPRLRITEAYLYTRLGGYPRSFPRVATSFNNHIGRIKLNYQFTRPLSLRLIVDYNAVLANPALAAVGPRKRFSGDLLLTYSLNPGTALYVGYTDIYENLRLQPPSSPAMRVGDPVTSTGRQFFVKLSYLLRF